MSGAGVYANEQIRAFEEGRGLGDGQPARPVAQPFMVGEQFRGRRVFRASDDDHPPAVLEEPKDKRPPVPLGPPFGSRAGAEMHRQEGGMVAESAGMQPVGIESLKVGEFDKRMGPATNRPAPPASVNWCFHPACQPAWPGLGQPPRDGDPIIILDVNLDPG